MSDEPDPSDNYGTYDEVVQQMHDAQRQLAEAEREIIEAHNHFAIQEGRIREARARAAEAEAVIEKVRAVVWDSGPLTAAIDMERVKPLLADDRPSAALAEVKAQAWDEGWNVAMHEDSGDYAQAGVSVPRNPYRKGAGE